MRFDEFKPQLAKGAVSVAAVASKSAMEPKLDGWRLLAHVDEDGVHLYSRSGKSYDGSLPHLEAELGERFPAGTVLDGEALAAEIGEGQVIHRWGTVQSVLGSSGTHPEHERVSFVVFDLLAHGGLDARPLPYTQRRALLEQIFEDEYATMQLVEQLPATEDAYETLVARGYEGAVVKRLDSRYSSGARGAGWSKVKPSETTDAFVVGFEEGTNGRTGSLGALRLARLEGGEVVEIGTCGSGLSDELIRRIDADREGWLNRVVEVVQLGGSGGEGWRPMSFRRERLDKSPEDC